MKTDRTQKGQALILIVFAVIALIALTGLAVDGSITYSNRQGAQNAADNAALTAALDMANSATTATAQSDALKAASTNGFNNDTTTNTVTVHSGGGFVAGCKGTTPSFSDNTQYVQVIINTNVNTSFSSIVGVKQTHNCVDAIARGQVGTTGAMFNGNAIVATGTGSNCTDILLNSSAQINATGGGVFDNCGSSTALTINSSSKITGPSAVQVVGGVLNNCGSSCIPEGVTTNATALTMPAAYWSTIPSIPAAPTCSGAGGATFTPIDGGTISISGSGSTATASVNVNSSASAALTPGNFSGLNIGSSASAVFSPGTYCLPNGFNLNSSASATGNSGTVSLVITDGNIQVGSSATMNNFNDLEIYSHNGGLTIGSSAIMAANKLRFYSTGTGTFIDNSSGKLSSSNAFFYLTGGYITLNSSATLSLSAPPTGDPYAGLLVYAPWGNSNNGIIINSSSSVNIIGTILAPSQTITLNSSGSANAFQSQIVGSTFTVNSSAVLNVSFQASQNYGTPTTAYVELVK
jgi:Flp pilus assembly protein TadG